MIKNVIFDLDGTLLDTREGIIESVKYTIKEFSFKELSYDTLLEFIGPPIQNSLMKHCGCDSDTAQKATDFYRDHYMRETLFRADPYDGIFDLCHFFLGNNVRMAVATYKREDTALKLLHHFGFNHYCNPIHGSDNNNVLKKEDIVRMCLDEMGAEKDNSVLVGDTVNDAKGAALAGIPFIAVTYGFGFKTDEELALYPNIGVAGTTMDVADIVFNKSKCS